MHDKNPPIIKKVIYQLEILELSKLDITLHSCCVPHLPLKQQEKLHLIS